MPSKNAHYKVMVEIMFRHTVKTFQSGDDVSYRKGKIESRGIKNHPSDTTWEVGQETHLKRVGTERSLTIILCIISILN